MAGVELYDSPGSIYARQVKLVLAEKNIQWKSHLINLFTFKNLEPAYIRINPRGVVPTLVHGEKVICDSVAIIHYLNKQFPHPQLIPGKSELQAKMNYWVNLQNNFPMREFMYANYKGIDGLVLRRSMQIKEKLIPQLIENNSDLREHYQTKLEDIKECNRIIRDEQNMSKINAKIQALLDQLEDRLNQYEWLCGSSYSLADSVWTSVLNSLEELKFIDLSKATKRPSLGSYFQRLKNRPSFKIAIQNDKTPTSFIVSGLRRIFLGF